MRASAPVETQPLQFTEVRTPEPGNGEVLVQVRYCGVCRTDLHVVEGELTPRKSPVIPGHQIVGVVEKADTDATRFPIGSRVGIAWLHRTDGTCFLLPAGSENLCDSPEFTGYTVNRGYTEYIVAPEKFIYSILERFADEQAAPLLCAGTIGFRSLRLSGIKPGARLGFYGFGAAAHVAIQVALYWDVEVYAATRDKRHQQLALELGAKWAAELPMRRPRGSTLRSYLRLQERIVPVALKALRKGWHTGIGRDTSDSHPIS